MGRKPIGGVRKGDLSIGLEETACGGEGRRWGPEETTEGKTGGSRVGGSGPSVAGLGERDHLDRPGVLQGRGVRAGPVESDSLTCQGWKPASRTAAGQLQATWERPQSTGPLEGGHAMAVG